MLKPIKNTCKGVQFFIKVACFKSATLLKLNSFTGIFHRFSYILCRLAILKNTYLKIFAERLQWLLCNITSILLIGSIPGLKSYNRISLKTFSIQILFLKNLYHLNCKSKDNFLNIEVFSMFFKKKGDSSGSCSSDRFPAC